MLPRFLYHKARTIEESLDLLAEHGPTAGVLAGGTDLLVAMKEGACAPRHIIDVKAIPELSGIESAPDGGISIGACVTVNELIEYEALPRGMEALRDASSVLATYQIRNRATVGGNICNASPACDLGPPLLVLGAAVRAVSPSGERRVAVRDFFTSVKETCLARDELIVRIDLPSARDTASVFAKRRRIRGHDLATASVAAAVGGNGGLRLGLGAVATRPLLVEDRGGGAPDTGGGSGFDWTGAGKRIMEAALAAISPVDDLRATAVYRRHMVEMLVRRSLELLKERARD
jgi:CO/xanthine dehydrogenase FAD-binding subunit